MTTYDPTERKCFYCKTKTGDPEDYRPYGPGGAYVCYSCGTSSAHIDTTDKMLEKKFSEIFSSGATGIIFGGLDGPAPLGRDDA